LAQASCTELYQNVSTSSIQNYLFFILELNNLVEHFHGL
jgi:hypothetical protein